MEFKHAVSRRRFVGGLAAALGYVSAGTGLDVFAQGRAAGQGRPSGAAASAADRGGLRRAGQAGQQREQLGHTRLGDEGHGRRLEVRWSLRLSQCRDSTGHR